MTLKTRWPALIFRNIRPRPWCDEQCHNAPGIVGPRVVYEWINDQLLRNPSELFPRFSLFSTARRIHWFSTPILTGQGAALLLMGRAA
jgi:hypothetical protein